MLLVRYFSYPLLAIILSTFLSPRTAEASIDQKEGTVVHLRQEEYNDLLKQVKRARDADALAKERNAQDKLIEALEALLLRIPKEKLEPLSFKKGEEVKKEHASHNFGVTLGENTRQSESPFNIGKGDKDSALTLIIEAAGMIIREKDRVINAQQQRIGALENKVSELTQTSAASSLAERPVLSIEPSSHFEIPPAPRALTSSEPVDSGFFLGRRMKSNLKQELLAHVPPSWWRVNPETMAIISVDPSIPLFEEGTILKMEIEPKVNEFVDVRTRTIGIDPEPREFQAQRVAIEQPMAPCDLCFVTEKLNISEEPKQLVLASAKTSLTNDDILSPQIKNLRKRLADTTSQLFNAPAPSRRRSWVPANHPHRQPLIGSKRRDSAPTLIPTKFPNGGTSQTDLSGQISELQEENKKLWEIIRGYEDLENYNEEWDKQHKAMEKHVEESNDDMLALRGAMHNVLTDTIFLEKKNNEQGLEIDALKQQLASIGDLKTQVVSLTQQLDDAVYAKALLAKQVSDFENEKQFFTDLAVKMNVWQKEQLELEEQNQKISKMLQQEQQKNANLNQELMQLRETHNKHLDDYGTWLDESSDKWEEKNTALAQQNQMINAKFEEEEKKWQQEKSKLNAATKALKDALTESEQSSLEDALTQSQQSSLEAVALMTQASKRIEQLSKQKAQLQEELQTYSTSLTGTNKKNDLEFELSKTSLDNPRKVKNLMEEIGSSFTYIPQPEKKPLANVQNDQKKQPSQKPIPINTNSQPKVEVEKKLREIALLMPAQRFKPLKKLIKEDGFVIEGHPILLDPNYRMVINALANANVVDKKYYNYYQNNKSKAYDAYNNNDVDTALHHKTKTKANKINRDRENADHLVQKLQNNVNNTFKAKTKSNINVYNNGNTISHNTTNKLNNNTKNKHQKQGDDCDSENGF